MACKMSTRTNNGHRTAPPAIWRPPPDPRISKPDVVMCNGGMGYAQRRPKTGVVYLNKTCNTTRNTTAKPGVERKPHRVGEIKPRTAVVQTSTGTGAKGKTISADGHRSPPRPENHPPNGKAAQYKYEDATTNARHRGWMRTIPARLHTTGKVQMAPVLRQTAAPPIRTLDKLRDLYMD